MAEIALSGEGDVRNEAQSPQMSMLKILDFKTNTGAL